MLASAIRRRAAARAAPLARALSAEAPLAALEPPADESGVATLRLARPPVNSLNLDLLAAIREGLAAAHADRGVKGLVLASSSPGIFSAGLDITEMWNPDEQRLREFWAALQGVWLELYSSPLATAAAVAGHSPAGGCLLAMCCDERVMAAGAGKKAYRIGLNETALGIVAPFWFGDTMQATIGARYTQRLLQTGALLTAGEAQAVGLVDAVVDAEAEAEPAAKAALRPYLAVNAAARCASKLQVREPALQRLRAVQQQDLDSTVGFLMSDKVQQSLGGYMEALRAKSG